MEVLFHKIKRYGVVEIDEKEYYFIFWHDTSNNIRLYEIGETKYQAKDGRFCDKVLKTQYSTMTGIINR